MGHLALADQPSRVWTAQIDGGTNRQRLASPPVVAEGKLFAIDVNAEVHAFDAGTDFTVAVEEEFQLLDPESLDLVNRFIDLLAFGARVPDGQPIRLAGLPAGMTCWRRGDENDPDFNNEHIEIVWPEAGTGAAVP